MNTSVMLDTGAATRLDRELFAWLGSSNSSNSSSSSAVGTADTFPYDSLLAHLRAVGKHFLAPELLERLAGCRELAGWEAGAEPSAAFLTRFLDVVLDKHDGRYDYQSYTALSLLRRPPPRPPTPSGRTGRSCGATGTGRSCCCSPT